MEIAIRAPSRRTLLRTNKTVQLIGLIVVTAVVAGGALDASRANIVTPLVRLDDAPPIGHRVLVQCSDDVFDPGIAIGEPDAAPDELQHVTLCPFGDRALVVVSDAPVHGRVLEGKLQAVHGDELWRKPVRTQGPTYERAYLDLTTTGEDRVALDLVLALGVGGLVGWGLFARRWWRRRLAK